MESTPTTVGYRYFLGLLVGYLLIIGFASFYLPGFISPARIARAGPGELFFLAGEFRLRWWNLRDITINILLYLPFGFLVAMTLAAGGQRLRSALHWWWGLIISFAAEVVQAFIGRFSDATDVLSNGAGYALGYAIASIALRRYRISPASLLGLMHHDRDGQLNTLAGIRFIYLALVLTLALLPLDISFSLTQVAGKLQPAGDALPGLIVDPFYQLRYGPDFQYLTLNVLVFLPLAFLSAFLSLRRGRVSRWAPAIHCLMLAVIMEGAGLFIRSARSDILVPVLGFLTGLAVAAVVAAVSVPARRAVPGANGGRLLLPSALLLYGVLLLAVSLAPYEFDLSLQALRNKLLYGSNLVPFRLHFAAPSSNAAVDLAREAGLYLPLGVLLTLWLRRQPRRVPAPLIGCLALLASLLVAGLMELLQLAVVRRYVDLTDVLLAAIGALAGVGLAPLFVSHRAVDSVPVTIQGHSAPSGPPG